jgi:hypothetical protein
MGWLSLRGRYTLTGNLQPGAMAILEQLLTQLFGDVTNASEVYSFEATSAPFGFGCSKEDAERKLPKPEPTAERVAAVEAAAAAAAAAERQATQSHH